MARMRNVETLRGTGRVLEDNQARVLLPSVDYVVIVQQEVVESATGIGAPETAGPFSARGYLIHDHFNPAVVDALTGKAVESRVERRPPLALPGAGQRRRPSRPPRLQAAVDGRAADPTPGFQPRRATGTLTDTPRLDCSRWQPNDRGTCAVARRHLRASSRLIDVPP